MSIKPSSASADPVARLIRTKVVNVAGNRPSSNETSPMRRLCSAIASARASSEMGALLARSASKSPIKAGVAGGRNAPSAEKRRCASAMQASATSQATGVRHPMDDQTSNGNPCALSTQNGSL